MVDTARVLGVRVDCVDVPRLHDFIGTVIDEGNRAQILNVNVNCLNLAHERPWLRTMLNEAPVVFCDGAGVQVAARLLGQPVPPRIPYNTWMWEFAPFAAARGYRLYLLGARPGVAGRAAARLRERHPTLQICGIRDGYFDRSDRSADNEAVIEDVNASGAHVLVLALGMPAQEEWLARHWPRLDVNIALNGGAVLDYLSGDLAMPPRWMADHGLEWLQRLSMDPRRLWRRYLVGNPQFMSRVARQRLLA